MKKINVKQIWEMKIDEEKTTIAQVMKLINNGKKETGDDFYLCRRGGNLYIRRVSE